MRAGTGTAVLALATLTALQQVFSRIPAPAAKIKRPGEVPDLPVLVQIERSISLSVLKYSRTPTQPPVPVPGRVSVRVCDIRNAGNDPMIPPLKGGKFNQAPFSSPMIDITCCNVLKRGAKREPVLQESLPGVLDPWMFEWVKTELGRCDPCDHGKAVYRSEEAQAKGATPDWCGRGAR